MRGALRGLDARNADRVAAHLVAAGTLLDEEPEQALAHARAARERAARIAAVREAVGVAAYHAGDYTEAARELRAYRRMSGDRGYRAVLADCERALGRPEVALRLVAEALAEHPDAVETAELQLVEAGARRDLGEPAAARLVLEAALGGRPRPSDLLPGDQARIRLATAYADLLADEGAADLAAEWHAAVAAADPDALEGAAGGIEFFEEEFPEGEPADDGRDVFAAGMDHEDLAPLPVDDSGTGETVEADFAAQVEAEVAELLGEDAEPSDASRRGDDNPH